MSVCSTTCPAGRRASTPTRSACTACSSTARRSSPTAPRPGPDPARCCAAAATPTPFVSLPTPDPLGERGDDVRAHEVDGLHHLVVRDLVRVDQAQQQVDARSLVTLARLDALVSGAEDARAR